MTWPHSKLSIRAQMLRASLVAFGFLVGTWLLFGPVVAWHHITVFGILGGVVLNGEGPHDPVRPQWEEQDVIVHPDRLTISALAWALFVLLLFWVTAKTARWADANFFISGESETRN
jgi:hypothetical protein